MAHGGGKEGTWCDSRDPNCGAAAAKNVGKNLWSMKTLDGIHAVQEWIKIARSGGGWVAYYWRDPSDKMTIQPKYTYIVPVPGQNMLVAAGFWATKKDITKEGYVRIEGGRRR